MCSFITQHNATNVASFEGACNWHADCRNVHQSCCPWIEFLFLYHKPSPKAFQRIWQYIQPASQPQTTCNHTSPGPLVFSSRINPGFHCTGQMADSVYGVVWVSGLLMSTLWFEWPMVAVGLWYGLAYVMDNEHRCILLMAFWMHRDTVTRSWGPLLCHSSTTSPHVAAW